MTEQHDHHCILSADGFNWRIAAVSGHLIDLRRPVGYGHCFISATLDVSRVDWDSYCAAAIEMDRAWKRRRWNGYEEKPRTV